MNTLMYIFRKNCLIFVSVGHHNYSFKTKNSIEKPMLMWICWESLVILFWIFIGCQSGETPIFPPWARDQSWIAQISCQKAWYICTRSFIWFFVVFLNIASVKIPQFEKCRMWRRHLNTIPAWCSSYGFSNFWVKLCVSICIVLPSS